MSMSRKDFIALADALRSVGVGTVDGEAGFSTDHSVIVEAVADFCARQNPRFNRGRWMGYITGENGARGGSKK